MQEFQRGAGRPALASLPLAERRYRYVEEACHYRLADADLLANTDNLGRRQIGDLR